MNRSGTLPRKDTLRLVASLQEQGCVIRHMKKGYRVQFPNGGSTMLHLTNSDSRGTLNTRAEIRRAGLSYPGDLQKETRSRKMGKTLTERQGVALRAVLDRIKKEGRFYGPVADMARDAGVSDHTLNRRLHALGWQTRGAGPSLVWYAPGAAPITVSAPVVEYPEIERARAMVGPGLGHERLTFPRDGEKTVEPNGRGSWPIVPAESGENKVNVKAAPPHVMPKATPEQVAEIVKRATAPEVVEFIDDRNSWTVDVPEKLQRMAEQLGLNIEVRVWR